MELQLQVPLRLRLKSLPIITHGHLMDIFLVSRRPPDNPRQYIL